MRKLEWKLTLGMQGRETEQGHFFFSLYIPQHMNDFATVMYYFDNNYVKPCGVQSKAFFI